VAHAEKCPICGGTGNADRTWATDSMIRIETCNGCFGTGWVTVQDTPTYITIYATNKTPQ